MAHKPPINRNELQYQPVLKADRFYQALANNCNYIDKETAKSFYMGLVKLITDDIKTMGIARLPHIGDLALVKLPPKSMLAGKQRVIMKDLYLIKFYIEHNYRSFWNMFTSDRSNLDPREKLLNKTITFDQLP